MTKKYKIIPLLTSGIFIFAFIDTLLYKIYNYGQSDGNSAKATIYDGFFGYIVVVVIIVICVSIFLYGLGFNNKFSNFGRKFYEGVSEGIKSKFTEKENKK